MNNIFLGKPPASIEQWIRDHRRPVVKETTVVRYTAASQRTAWEGDIVGLLTSSSIPNKTDAEEVDIGSHVTGIDSSVFSECSNLTTVAIPDGITTIKDNAFYKCTNL